jgi:hypothetical protein
MTDDRVTLRVPGETLAALDAARGDASRSAWILAAVGRKLSGVSSPGSAPAPAAVPAALAGLQPGAASPGVLCSGPGCSERDTARYGLRLLPLCRACAAALAGEVYRRPAAAPRVTASGRRS